MTGRICGGCGQAAKFREKKSEVCNVCEDRIAAVDWKGAGCVMVPNGRPRMSPARKSAADVSRKMRKGRDRFLALMSRLSGDRKDAPKPVEFPPVAPEFGDRTGKSGVAGIAAKDADGNVSFLGRDNAWIDSVADAAFFSDAESGGQVQSGSERARLWMEQARDGGWWRDGMRVVVSKGEA